MRRQCVTALCAPSENAGSNFNSDGPSKASNVTQERIPRAAPSVLAEDLGLENFSAFDAVAGSTMRVFTNPSSPAPEVHLLSNGSYHVVISSAVLHFARDDAQFDAMLRGSMRVLKPDGLFFCRLASSIGIESQIRQVGGRRYKLPDASVRYLVDEALLESLTEQLGEMADPLKTTVVQNQRSMTTWVVRKTR